MRRLAAILATGMLAFAAAGCGGDDNGGGERLSKDEYAAQANAICDDFNADVKAAGPEPQGIKDIPPYVDKVKPLFEDGLSRLKKLNPPEDEQETVDEWLDTAEEQIGYLGDIKKAAEDNDLAEVQEVGTKISASNKKADALAVKLGATSCTDQ